jgi:hypothetical protein
VPEQGLYVDAEGEQGGDGHEYDAVTTRAEGIGFAEEGNCLLRSRNRSAWPGSQIPGRADGYRAPGPGLRPVDVQRLLVLWPGHRGAGPQRVPLRLRGLAGARQIRLETEVKQITHAIRMAA